MAKISKRVEITRNLCVHAINILLEKGLITLEDSLDSDNDKGITLQEIGGIPLAICWGSNGREGLAVKVAFDIDFDAIRKDRLKAYKIASAGGFDVKSPFELTDLETITATNTIDTFNGYAIDKSRGAASCYFIRGLDKYLLGNQNSKPAPGFEYVPRDPNCALRQLPIAEPKGYKLWKGQK